MQLLLKHVCLPGVGGLQNVAIEDRRIQAIGKDVGGTAQRTVDGEGRVLIPAPVDGHIHLDKAFIAGRMANRSGTLQEAIEVTSRLKPTFTRQDTLQRAEQALLAMVNHGTLALRAHSEFDPQQGFVGFEATLELRRRYEELVTLQIVAFPQEGIFKTPGTAEMMEEALKMGADVVGGIPYNDLDAKQHIDFVFQLAQKYGKPIDLHQDFADNADALSIGYVCDKTMAEGYEGRVSVGHLTALGALPPKKLVPLADKIARAGISVMCLPATDLHLGGRGDNYNIRRTLAPVRALRDMGVNVCLATNNIRNAFTPYGNGDLFQIAMLGIPTLHLGGADDLPTVLPMITGNPAKAMGLDGYGLAPGCRADLVLLDTQNPEDAIIDMPRRILVIRGGQVVLEHLHETLSSLPYPHSGRENLDEWAADYGAKFE